MSDTPTLFLVVLGGRTATRHIELHDVRWVGIQHRGHDSSAQATMVWAQTGLHIDSYVGIEQVDGYKVELIRDRHECVGDGDSNRDERSDQLWFVNLGGYDGAHCRSCISLV